MTNQLLILFFSWGTYIGNGKAGPQNPNSLHFPFDPKFFYLYEIVNISDNGAKRNKGLKACDFFEVQIGQDTRELIYRVLHHPVFFFPLFFSNKTAFGAYGDFNSKYGFFSKKENNSIFWYCYNPISFYQIDCQFNKAGTEYLYYAFG